MIAVLRKYWKQQDYVDMRLGQIVGNAAGYYDTEHVTDEQVLEFLDMPFPTPTEIWDSDDDAAFAEVMQKLSFHNMFTAMSERSQRPIERIDPLLDSLQQYWLQRPERSLSSLLTGIVEDAGKSSMYYIEDADVLSILEKYTS